MPTTAGASESAETPVAKKMSNKTGTPATAETTATVWTRGMPTAE